MIRKFFDYLLNTKTIAEVQICHSFYVYPLVSETYTITFRQNLFERYIEVAGSKFVTEQKIWIGNEFYIITIRPWLMNQITTEEFRGILKQFHGLVTGDQMTIKNKDNIIRPPADIWKNKPPTT